VEKEEAQSAWKETRAQEK